jgi:N utilization substance protein B
MKKASRHESRECLLQALYGRSVLREGFSLPRFLSSYYDERFENMHKDAYFSEAFAGIVSKEAELASVVHRFAPKFDVSMMPVVNLLPIFIASYEMLYLKCDAVPEKVSIDEAIELTKRFSDDNARTLVNGVLNSLKDELATVKTDLEGASLTKPGIF